MKHVALVQHCHSSRRARAHWASFWPRGESFHPSSAAPDKALKSSSAENRLLPLSGQSTRYDGVAARLRSTPHPSKPSCTSDPPLDEVLSKNHDIYVDRFLLLLTGKASKGNKRTGALNPVIIDPLFKSHIPSGNYRGKLCNYR